MLVLALLLFQADPLSKAELEKHVLFLASDEMKGRDNGTEEGRKAAEYVARRFRECGLKAGGKDGFFHDFTMRSGVSGRNVIGLLEGAKASEYVVVAAHHDARGVIGGKVQNGADDDASGVALVLGLAGAFAAEKPARSILFISFDAEEDGLVGSREFVKSGLYDPAAFTTAFVLDLVGGDMFEWEKSRVYAMGAEYSEALSGKLKECAGETKDLEVVAAPVALIEPFPGIARSDYNAFRRQRVPFVFFSTGTPWYYHTEHDDVGRLNLEKMEKLGRFLRKFIAGTAAAARPDFRKPAMTLEDAGLVKAQLEKILENKDRLGLGEKRAAAIRGLADRIGAMEEPDLWVLQPAMLQVLSAAALKGGK